LFKTTKEILNQKEIESIQAKAWFYQCKNLFALHLNNIIPWIVVENEAKQFGYYAKDIVRAGFPYVEMARNYFEKQGDSPKRTYLKPKIFLVHGRNTTLRDKIDIFITKELHIETIIMEAGPNSGRTLPEKFEEMAAETNIALFIYSADDDLIIKNEDREIKRARQNVVLETGYFWGALGRRGKIVFLVDDDPDLELPSDILGIGWIKITKDLGETKLRLQKEIFSFLNVNKE